MKLLAFSVRDSAVEQYGNPMFMLSRGQAHRSFADEVNRPAEDNQMYKHPTDFELYLIGEYDTDTGHYEPCMPDLVARGKDVYEEK